MDIATLGFKVDSTQLTKLNSELTKLKSTSAQADRSTQTTTNNISKMNTATSSMVGSLKTMIGVYAGFEGIKAVARVADQYTLLESKLNLVVDSTDEFNSVYNELYRISQQTGTSFTTNAQAFANLAINMKSSGVETKETLGLFETFNKALIVNGSSQQEAAGATLQFKQALSSGLMAGEEFRGVVEGNTYYMSKLAEAMGMTIGELREFSRDQKLTTDIIMEANRKMAASVDEDFGGMQKTLARGLQELINASQQWIALGDDISKTTGSIADMFSWLAEQIGNSAEGWRWWISEINDPKNKLTSMINDLNELGESIDRLTAERDRSASLAAIDIYNKQIEAMKEEWVMARSEVEKYRMVVVDSELDKVFGEIDASIVKVKESTVEAAGGIEEAAKELESFFSDIDAESSFLARKKATDDYIMSLNYVASAKKTETDFWLLQEQHKQDIEKETTSVINEEQEKRLETYWYYADQIVDSFKSGIYDGIMQSLGETENAWDAMWKGMLATMASVLAEMAARWAASEIANLAGWSLNTHHTGLWNLLDDEELAILQKGEMVIPQSQSDAIRSNLGSMNDGSFDALVQATNNANPDSWEGQVVGRVGTNYIDDIIGSIISAIMTGDISGSIGNLMSADVATKNVGGALKDQIMEDVLGFDGIYSNTGSYILRGAGLAGLSTTSVPYSQELLSMVGSYFGNKVGDLLNDREFEQLRDYYEDGEISKSQLRSMVNADTMRLVSSWDGTSPSPLTGGSSLGGFFDSIGSMISSPVKSLVNYVSEMISAREAEKDYQSVSSGASTVGAMLGGAGGGAGSYFSLGLGSTGEELGSGIGGTSSGMSSGASSIGSSLGGAAGSASGYGYASGGVINKVMVPNGDDGFIGAKLGEGMLKKDTMDVLSKKIENGTFGDEKVIELLNSILRAVVQTGSKTNKNTKDINNILNTIKATGLRTV